MKQIYYLRHLKFDFNDHKAYSNEIEVNLDHKAIDVLKVLVTHKDQTVATQTFMDEVWFNKPSSPEVVPAAIARLRKLFKQTGLNEEIITTVHKVGYHFNSLPDQSTTQNQEQPKKPSLMLKTWVLILAASLIASMLYIYKFNVSNPQEAENLISNKLNQINPNSSIHAESDSNATQIYILRHTEKISDTAENPDLSPAGIERAKYWKKVTQHIEFDQVFTTDFKRNIQTANLISDESAIKPELYYPMSFEVVKFINLIRGKKVLIIGHSNTIPDMVNRLIGETKYPPMSHQNYNIMYIVTINNNGDTSSSMLHIENP